MGLRTLHHVGYVVSSIGASAQGFIRSLGVRWDAQIFEDLHQRVKVTFLSAQPGEPLIELVEPVGEKSPVRKFLEEKGGGLHHLCYETETLESELRDMLSRSAMLVRRPRPAVAFGGRRIAWLLTQENLLVELLEKTALPGE
jgi:methylmalonyl-CoA/ethylmalonyl-CoA epimerase